mmetsp:Transcript_4365/g.19559  ORF Transcript_4365/g.19559 Transcript_4365/m.19559 type:complete len:205 (-) Transcript_4365:149-763(-)
MALPRLPQDPRRISEPRRGHLFHPRLLRTGVHVSRGQARGGVGDAREGDPIRVPRRGVLRVERVGHGRGVPSSARRRRVRPRLLLPHGSQGGGFGVFHVSRGARAFRGVHRGDVVARVPVLRRPRRGKPDRHQPPAAGRHVRRLSRVDSKRRALPEHLRAQPEERAEGRRGDRRDICRARRRVLGEASPQIRHAAELRLLRVTS